MGTPPPGRSVSDQALEQLRKYYFYLNDNFATLIGRCSTDAERNQVKMEFVAARDAYFKAENEILVEHDETLATLTNQLDDLQSQISSAVESAGNITKILQAVSVASGIAAKIATMGG